jgi:hypothetical protein
VAVRFAHIAFILLSIATHAAHAIAQPVEAGEPTAAATAQAVRSRLELEANAYNAQNFELATAPVALRASRSAPAHVVVPLTGGTQYVLLAHCDSDCSQIELSLINGQDVVLTQSAGQRGLTAVNGVPVADGLYEVVLAVPSCRERICHAGLAILVENPGQNAVMAAVVTTKSHIDPAPGWLANPATMAMSPNQQIDGDGYAVRVSATYGHCELHCILDRRCMATSFQQASLLCALYDQERPLSPHPQSTVGLKRQSGPP